MLSFLLLLLTAIPIYSESRGTAHIPLPAELNGTLNGSEYKIRVPGNWNGTLVVYCHAAVSGALQVAPATFPQASPTLEEQLLQRGYALAGSFYPDSEKEAPLRTLALTNFFNGHVGQPRRTIVWGLSIGGTAALELIEGHHAIYDAAIAVSSLAGGGPLDADASLRCAVAYAAAFGWPSDWWGPIEDLRDDIYGNEGALMGPVFRWADAGNLAQWEFIRLIMKLPSAAWWDVDPLIGFQGYFLAAWKGIAFRSRAEQLYGGPVAQNVGAFYSLSASDKAYLLTLGLNADNLLAWMNAHANITARNSARQHLAHYGNPTGNLRRPVVTMHAILDPDISVSHEAVYRAKAEATGSAGLLVQAFANAWHASFSADQYLAALAAIEHWLDT